MLSYQHIFHAGNHADILKHFVLYQVLVSLNKKDKPYAFFDTHSGSGLYDLTDIRSLKTGEAGKGVQRLLGSDLKKSDSAIFNSFIDFISSYVRKNFYPGSPEIERSLMRPQDSLVLAELHPQEIESLRHNILGRDVLVDGRSSGWNGGPQISIHKRNGWEMLRALTPPAQKRGAVLIDPSYEETVDYTDAARTICEVHKKWSNGIIMLWYPLLAHRESDIRGMTGAVCSCARSINPHIEICDLQLCVYGKEEKDLPRLYGSGMLVLNAPWKLREETGTAIELIKSEIAVRSQTEGKA